MRKSAYRRLVADLPIKCPRPGQRGTNETYRCLGAGATIRGNGGTIASDERSVFPFMLYVYLVVPRFLHTGYFASRLSGPDATFARCAIPGALIDREHLLRRGRRARPRTSLARMRMRVQRKS